MGIEEKPVIEHVESASSNAGVEEKPSDYHEQYHIDPKKERKLLRKLDLAILPMTVLMYLSAQLDRGNLGNARLQGLQTEILDGSDTKYSVTLLAFYITYVLGSIPGTLLSKAIRPNLALGGGCIIWAIAATCFAGTQNFAGAVVCRLFIGLGESIFGQGIVLHYSLWYRKNEISKRLSLFIGMGALAGAFGGLIAYGVAHIKSHLQTWRILFLIEGLPSFVLGCLVVAFLPSRPDRSHYLNAEETELEMARLASENLDEGDDGIDWNGVKRAVTAWQTYAVTFIFSCMQLLLASLGGFFPTIIKSLGYTDTDAQLFTVPPYAVAFVAMMFINTASDKMRIRGPFIAGVFGLNVVGFATLLGTENMKARYFACFCIVLGCYCAIPLVQSWVANNCGSQSQRAVHLGYLNSVGNYPAFIAPFIFPTKDAPQWKLGYGINLGFSAAAIVVALLMIAYYKYENKRRDRVEGKPYPGQFIDVVNLHDLAPGFRYTL